MKNKLLFLLISFFAVTYTNATKDTTISSGDWNDPGTWKGNHVPGPNDTAVVAQSDLINVTDNSQCLHIKINGHVLILQSCSLGSSSDGDIEITASGGIDLDIGASIYTYGSIYNDGAINGTSQCSLLFSKNYYSNGGTLNLGNNATFECGDYGLNDPEHIFNLSNGATIGSRNAPLNSLTLYDSTKMIAGMGDSIFVTSLSLLGGKLTNASHIVLGTGSTGSFTMGSRDIDRPIPLIDNHFALNCPSKKVSIFYQSINNTDITTGPEIPADGNVNYIEINALTQNSTHSNITLSDSIFCDSLVGLKFNINNNKGRNLILGNYNLHIKGYAGIPTPSTGYIVTNGDGALKMPVAPLSRVVFPIGPSTISYDTMSIYNAAGPLDTFGVKVQGPVFSHLPNDTSKTVKREWDITEAVPGGNTTNLSFTYDAAAEKGANYNAMGSIVIGHYTGGNWVETSAIISGNTVSANGFTSFSPFAVGNAGGLLPIRLLSFNANLQHDNNVLIRWSVTNERNNKEFVIERSLDGIHFLPVATIPGKNNFSFVDNYEFVDKQPIDNILYYRLKQMDINGIYTYSYIVTVKKSIKQVYTIYPNPVKNEVFIYQNLISNSKIAQIVIYDNNGHKVYQHSINMNNGSAHFNLSKLEAGNYIMKLNNETETYTIPFLKL